MKPARYIFLNKGLGMSPGKCAAQAAHSETLAMMDFFSAWQIDPPSEGLQTDIELYSWFVGQKTLFDKWYGDGHYVKYVMEASESMQMYTIDLYLKERGFKTYFVIDEGRTEGTYLVPTALAVELVDKEDQRVSSIFSTFRLYKDDTGPRKPSQSEGDDLGFMTFLRRMRGGKTH